MKIVINRCFGGFSLSKAAADFLRLDSPYDEIERDNPLLVGLVEADTKIASGKFAHLKIVEIPDGITDWDIDNYDGMESIIYVLNGKIHYAC